MAEGTDSTAAETLPEAPRKARGKAPGRVRGRRRLQHRHRSRVGLWLALALIVLALALGVVGMALTAMLEDARDQVRRDRRPDDLGGTHRGVVEQHRLVLEQ